LGGRSGQSNLKLVIFLSNIKPIFRGVYYTKSSKGGENVANVVLTVQGMSCAHCVNSIEGALGKLSGVEKAKVSLKEESVSVIYNENEVTLNQIKETIEEQGYEVKEPITTPV
jgi:copper chaperone